MADKPFIAKIMEVLAADAELKTILGNSFKVCISRYSPVDNVYPQISVWVDDKGQQGVLPAGKYGVLIAVWLSESDKTPYTTGAKAYKRITKMFNLERSSSATSLNDLVNNLRVVSMNREGGEPGGFDNSLKKHFAAVEYEAVVSEDEDYDS